MQAGSLRYVGGEYAMLATRRAAPRFPRMDALGYIDCGDNREEILYPWIRDTVLARDPRRVLDFGCGDARFALQLARLIRNGRVTAYDRDPHMREQARRRIGAVASSDAGQTGACNVVVCDAPEADWTGAFDAVVMLGVWMCWRTHAECVETLSLLARSLTPGGVLIAAVTHPCFRDCRFATYRTDFGPANYLANGTPFQVFVGERGKEIVIEDYHWNLEAMMAQATEAGLRVATLKEHSDGLAGELPSWLSLVFTRA